MPNQEKSPLRWRARKVAPSHARRVRLLTRTFAAGVTDDATVPAPTIELPDLVAHPTPLEKAVRLLQVAAGIEHGLMIQYLYAGYGFSPQTNPEIVSIAMEEMTHLMTVQNLLRLVGLEPHLGRQDFGPPDADEERLFPFDLLLEPVTHESLAKYVVRGIA